MSRLSWLSLNKKNVHILKYGLLGLFFYIIFLIINIPADWLAWGVNKYSYGTTILSQAGGSLWGGRAYLSINPQTNKPIGIGQIAWRIKPWQLFIGRLNFTLTISGEGLLGRVHLSLGTNSIEINKLRASIAAPTLSSFYSPVSLISPQGKILITAKTLLVDEDGIKGNAEANWSNASSTLSPVQPLGNYNLKLNGVGKKANLVLKSGQGPLKLAGQGSWDVTSGQINFSGTATPISRKADLNTILSFLGREIGSGKRMFRFRTQLPFKYSKRKSTEKKKTKPR